MKVDLIDYNGAVRLDIVNNMLTIVDETLEVRQVKLTDSQVEELLGFNSNE